MYQSYGRHARAAPTAQSSFIAAILSVTFGPVQGLRLHLYHFLDGEKYLFLAHVKNNEGKSIKFASMDVMLHVSEVIWYVTQPYIRVTMELVGPLYLPLFVFLFF